MSRSQRMWWLTALAGVSQTACANDLDSLFCDPEAAGCPASASQAPVDGPVEEEAPPPILPFLPDEGARQACETCSADACDAARNNCLEDDACTAQLRCLGECADPGCTEECRGKVALDGWSSFYWDLYKCAYSESCADECQSGQNWDCKGDFRWPRSDQLSLDVYARFLGTPEYEGSLWRATLAGATARACLYTGLCPFTEEPVPLDAASGAALTLPVESIEETFKGYFEVEGRDVGGLGTFHRIHTLPLAYGGNIVPSFTPTSLSHEGYWIVTPTSAVLWAVVVDCTGQHASQVRLAIAERPDASVLHVTGEAARESATVSTSGVAVFPSLEVAAQPQEVTVQAYLAEGDGEKMVAERRIELRAGWQSSLVLAPVTSSGL